MKKFGWSLDDEEESEEERMLARLREAAAEAEKRRRAAEAERVGKNFLDKIWILNLAPKGCRRAQTQRKRAREGGGWKG